MWKLRQHLLTHKIAASNRSSDRRDHQVIVELKSFIRFIELKRLIFLSKLFYTMLSVTTMRRNFVSSLKLVLISIF